MKQQLLGALIGLARALCENEHMATGETELLLRAGLLASEAEAAEMLPRVRAEKCRIVPDCAACGFSCDKNADYDLSALADADPELRDRTQELLRRLPGLAETGELALLTLTLRAVGDFWTPEALDRVLQQLTAGGNGL